MILTELDLTNFRNYSKKSFKFDKTTAIIGKNGLGKTNILEAIRYLSIMKSFRAKREREVIKFDEEVARIVGRGEAKEEKIKIAIGLTNDRKQVEVNQAKKRVSQAVGYFKTVLFSPDDLDFVSGPPTLRRRFLDSIISQENPIYLTALLSLQKVVKQRNAILFRISKDLAQKDELLFWDQELVKHSLLVQPLRKELVNQLNEGLSQRYEKISGQTNSKMKIEYQENKISLDILESIRSKDLRYTTTTVGPHHDDLVLELNNNPLAAYGSRGEKRSAILSLKQAEIGVLTKDEPPILLLDDILSELDLDRQGRLINLFEGQQTIITATELPKELFKKIDKIIELE